MSLRSLWVRFSSPGLYELSDEELMLQVRDREDQKAFCVLYDRYKVNLFQWFYWNTNARALAEDLTQEVFLKAYNHRRSYSPKSFRGWLYTIARHQLIDHFKKKKEVLVDDLDQRLSSGFEELDDVEQQLILKQTKQELLEAIEELSPRVREALTLWLAEEWSYEQMADMLDCSVQAVKNLVHRGRKDLVAWFQEERK
jgi:RNA polymerase sigma-70 factor, ECF subfamily